MILYKLPNAGQNHNPVQRLLRQHLNEPTSFRRKNKTTHRTPPQKRPVAETIVFLENYSSLETMWHFKSHEEFTNRFCSQDYDKGGDFFLVCFKIFFA